MMLYTRNHSTLSGDDSHVYRMYQLHRPQKLTSQRSGISGSDWKQVNKLLLAIKSVPVRGRLELLTQLYPLL